MLGSVVIEDIEDVLGQMDIQYPTGLKKILYSLHGYTAPLVIATPKLASLLHTSLSCLLQQHKELVQDICMSSQQPYQEYEELQRGVRWHPDVDPPNVHSLTAT